MATCMLLDSGLEKRFWGEAVLTATYLQNRLPSRSVERTPYELWWGRKPDLSHLRVFGSEAFVSPSVKRGKTENRERKLTLVGYSMKNNEYRFVDRTTNEITVSRDARFVELGNGSSSSVEFPVVPEEERREAVEEVKMLPFKDNGEEAVGAKTPGSVPEDPMSVSRRENELSDESEPSVYDSLNDDEQSRSCEVRRSTRKNRGVVPRYLKDFELDLAAGSTECVKKKEQRQAVKCKACIVAQGYAQNCGLDFEQVCAPVTEHATFRTFLAVTAKKTVNAELKGEVFLGQPPGYAVPNQEELSSSGYLKLEGSPADAMMAGTFTKPQGSAKLKRFRELLGGSS